MTADELEERLIKFAIDCIKLTSMAKKSYASDHMNGQLIRSATSPPLNYSEARAGESHRDYIHKMQICLKELRESRTNLRIQIGTNFYEAKEFINELLIEANELVLIFSKSVSTSKKNNRKV
jgi:four helix bundle protein